MDIIIIIYNACKNLLFPLAVGWLPPSSSSSPYFFCLRAVCQREQEGHEKLTQFPSSTTGLLLLLCEHRNWLEGGERGEGGEVGSQAIRMMASISACVCLFE